MWQQLSSEPRTGGTAAFGALVVAAGQNDADGFESAL